MRYLPLTPQDRKAMLATIGANSIDDLFCDVPSEAWLDEPVDLPAHASEIAVERHMSRLALQNHAAGEGPCFLGAGAYRHHVPASVDHLIQRGEFLTAYTPYQPEIAQGTLQVLFEFQTQVALLTGMEVANASMYDGATSCAEAVMMAARATRRHKAVLSGNLHPHYRDVTETLCRMTDFPIAETAPNAAGADVEALAAAVDDSVGCVVVQYPDVFGHIADLAPLAAACHAAGALMVVVCTEIVSLGALQPRERAAQLLPQRRGHVTASQQLVQPRLQRTQRRAWDGGAVLQQALRLVERAFGLGLGLVVDALPAWARRVAALHGTLVAGRAHDGARAPQLRGELRLGETQVGRAAAAWRVRRTRTDG